MRSTYSLAHLPVGTPLIADELVEFHAARILLLLTHCGVRGRIEGLTKLAKLDFFVRYPGMFQRATNITGSPVEDHRVESPMVRHHYGPWDPRYYHVLAYLESRGLIAVEKTGARTFQFRITEVGSSYSQRLSADPAYTETVAHMRSVKRAFGSLSGDRLKNIVYEAFGHEVASLPLGKEIQ